MPAQGIQIEVRPNGTDDERKAVREKLNDWFESHTPPDATFTAYEDDIRFIIENHPLDLAEKRARAIVRGALDGTDLTAEVYAVGEWSD